MKKIIIIVMNNLEEVIEEVIEEVKINSFTKKRAIS